MSIPPFGSPPTPAATTTKQGKIKLAGVLGGTADLPTFAAGTTGTGLVTLQTSPTVITPTIAQINGASNLLTLQADTAGAFTGVVQSNDPLSIMPGTFTGVSGANFIRILGTYTLSSTASVGQAFQFQPTVVMTGANTTFVGTLFTNSGSWTNANNYAGNMGAIGAFINQFTATADTQNLTQTKQWSFMDRPRYRTSGGATMTVTDIISFYAANYPTLNTLASGVTVDLRRGFLMEDWAGAGTLTTQVGYDVGTLTKGTTNIGIRNASTYVATPSANQPIDAATDTILANAELVRISNATGGAITLTSNPTIADGVSGQMLTIIQIGADNVVLTNGNNLRLPGAANLTLGQWDVVTLYWDTTDSQWIALSNSNN
jgi:hypothetical protein